MKKHKTKLSGTIAIHFLIMYLLMTSLIGCTVLQQDKYGELRLAQETFVTVITSVTDLYIAGQIGEDETEQIGAAIHAGENYLIAWQKAIEAGTEHNEIAALFTAVLEQLVVYTEQ